MSGAKSIFLWGALAVAILLGVIWELYPLSDASQRLDRLPRSGFGYNSQDLPVTEMEKEVFPNVGILKRLYQVGHQSFFLTVLDGTQNRNAVHDPSYCFQGSGWATVDRREIVVENGYVEILVLEKDEQKREIALWFSNGEERYGSVVRYWLDATLRRLSLGYSSDEPVRVIIQPATATGMDWERLFIDFTPVWEI